jgi:hypothetical protein
MAFGVRSVGTASTPDINSATDATSYANFFRAAGRYPWR